MRTRSVKSTIAQALQVGGTFLFVVILYLGRDVLIPIALGTLVAFAMNPIVTWLQRWGLSNVTAVVSTAVLVLLVLSAFMFSIGSSVSGFSDEIPKYRTELKNKLDSVRTLIASFGQRVQTLTKVIDDSEKVAKADLPEESKESNPTSISDQLLPTGKDSDLNDGSSPQRPLYVVGSDYTQVDLKSWAGGAAALLGPIGTAGLVIVFALFGLMYREDLRDRLVSVIAHGNYVVTTDALNEASQRIGKYLVAQLALNISYGLIFSVGLIGIGYLMTPEGWFPYVAVLGTLAALVRFVPYVGPLIGAAVPLTLSVLLFPGFQVLAGVAVLIVVMELVFNNILEPWLYGSSTGVSPMAVILSAVFWGWLWGPIGLLLATPLTVCAVVLGQYVPRFRFLSMLLSDEIQVKVSVRAYQRLLSGEPRRINELMTAQANEAPTAQLIDEVLVPTIKLILDDEVQRTLSDEQLLSLLRTGAQAAGIVAESPQDVSQGSLTEQLDDSEQPSISAASEVDSAGISGDSRSQLIAIPVRNVGEQLVMEAVAHSLVDVADMSVFENDDMPDRDAERLAVEQPLAIVVAVIPPGGMEQARYWCSALRRAGFRGEILVACFGKFKNYDRLLLSFRKRGANQLITSGNQLIQKLQRLIQRTNSKQRKADDLAGTTQQLTANDRETPIHLSITTE